MSQKISSVSLRLCNNKGFSDNTYCENGYIQCVKNNVKRNKLYRNIGCLKLKRSQINRRLRLKHTPCLTGRSTPTKYLVCAIPYKIKICTFTFKKPLAGVQFNYSVRPVQKRKKQVYL